MDSIILLVAMIAVFYFLIIRPENKRKKQAEQMERMMNDPAGKAFTLALADRVFRPSSPARGAELFRYLLDGYGIPRYLSAADRFAMKLGDKFSVQFPGVVMPMITSQLRKESSNVILPAEDGKLRSHLRRRRKAGIRMNINQLGEAILGESPPPPPAGRGPPGGQGLRLYFRQDFSHFQPDSSGGL